MKISAKAKDCSLLVKVKATGREKIDEKDLERFSRAYMRCFLKPKQFNSGSVEYTGPIGVSLKERLKKEITKRDFLFIIEYIVVAIQKLRGNTFPLCNLKLDLEHIFMNETTKELQFLYVPLLGSQVPGNVVELLNAVIYLTHPAAENDTEYVSRFNYFVKSLNPFDIGAVERFVQHEDPSVVNTVRKHNLGQSGFMTSSHKRYYDHMDAQKQQDENAVAYQAERPATVPVADEEATALLADGNQMGGWPAGYGDTAGPGDGFVQNPTPPMNMGVKAEAEEATGLLTDFEQSAAQKPVGNPGGYEETAIPYDGFNQTPTHQMPMGGMADAEATGLLTDFEQSAAPQPARNFAGYGDTASPGTGFVQNSGYFPGNEEATGLLTEQPWSPNAFQAPPPQNCYEEEATTLLTEDNGTTLLEDAWTPPVVTYPELYRTRTGEKIQVNKPVFRLGKERSYVDYFVTDNSAVSRSHADIITRESGCFVIDLNSKNRTFINNQAIPPQTETILKDGDVLRLGNEEFFFHLGGSPSAMGQRRCSHCNTPVVPGSAFCVACGQRLQG